MLDERGLCAGHALTDAFAKYGWCTAIRGAEGGGKVENLPTHIFTSDDGDLDQKCPTEIGITDRREAELGKLGFLPLCHYKNTDYAVFFGAQTTQKPKKYDRPDATGQCRDLGAPALHHGDLALRALPEGHGARQDRLLHGSRGLRNLAEPLDHRTTSTPTRCRRGDEGAKYPLREAKVSVKEIPGKPGSYNAVAYLRPWLQMEELTTSLRMVARIPSKH